MPKILYLMLVVLFLATLPVMAQAPAADSTLICQNDTGETKATGTPCNPTHCIYRTLPSEEEGSRRLLWTEIAPLSPQNRPIKALKVRFGTEQEDREQIPVHPVFDNLEALYQEALESYLAGLELDRRTERPSGQFIQFCREKCDVCTLRNDTEPYKVDEGRQEIDVTYIKGFRLLGTNLHVTHHILYFGRTEYFRAECRVPTAEELQERIRYEFGDTIEGGSAINRTPDPGAAVQTTTEAEVTDPKRKTIGYGGSLGTTLDDLYRNSGGMTGPPKQPPVGPSDAKDPATTPQQTGQGEASKPNVTKPSESTPVDPPTEKGASGSDPKAVLPQSPPAETQPSTGATTMPQTTQDTKTQSSLPVHPNPNNALAVSEDLTHQMIREMCIETLNLYRTNLRSIVDAGWHPPKPPQKGVWQARLQYNLLRSGGVGNVRILQSSGFSALDQAAIQRVYAMQGQFRPLPSCYTEPALEIEHTFKVIYR
jgi:TonB family protein